MAYRNYSAANGFLVDPSGNGDFTTIVLANAAAVSGKTIFIRPGTYSGTFTAVAGVNYVAWPGDDNEGNVVISGKVTFTAAGTVTFSNIRFTTSSDFFLAVTGNSASSVNLESCYLNCTNNTGISFTSSSASSQIYVNDCEGDLGTTGIAIFSHSASGNLRFQYSILTNTGASTTASTCSAGNVAFINSQISSPVTISGTGGIQNQDSVIDTSSINQISLTAGGSGTQVSTKSFYTSGTASAITISQTLTMSDDVVDSTNTNAITGAGTLINTGVFFRNSSSKINTSTQTARNLDVGGISFDGGTNILSTFTNWTSWTPTLLGASTAGTTTYSAQNGQYCRIGNIVFLQCDLTWSAATGTGNMLLGGFPFTVSASQVTSGQPISTGSITLPVGTVTASLTPVASGTTANVIASGTATGLNFVAMANAAGEIRASFFYRI